MEVLLTILIFVLVPIIGAHIENNEDITKKAKERYILSILLLISITIISYIVPEYNNRIDITTRTDVLQYEEITYAKSKTIVETKTIYPFWSIRNDLIEYTVEDY